MRVTRREFLIGSSAALGMIATPAVAKLGENFSSEDFLPGRPDKSFSILNRIAYGGTPEQQQHLDEIGLKKYLEYQLNPQHGTDAACNERLSKATLHIEYKAKDMKPGDKPDETWPAVKEDRPLLTLGDDIEDLWKLTDGKRVNYNEQIRPAQEVRSATWLRAVYSEWQLREVMVEFWHNHFNVNAFGDGHIGATWPVYDAIMRRNCFGNFRIFLEDVAKSTAMLLYLNNAKSKASPANENYARELFELHTLGADHYYNNLYNRWREVPGAVHGAPIGYIDQDVYEAARAFTGWTIEDGSNTGRGTTFPSTGKFTYFDGWHDNYQKRVLGNEFDPNAPPMADGNKVLDLVAHHPGTAIYLCTKLCRRLVSDEPPKQLLTRAVKTWQKYAKHPEQIKYVLRTIILSPEFADSEGRKVKRPFEFVASFLRTTGASFVPNEHLFNSVADAGYRHFSWPMPTGHPDTAEFWINTSSTLTNWNIAADLASGGIKDANFDMKAQTPADIRTSRQLVYYWTRRMVGKEPDDGLFSTLMQFTPHPTDAYFVPDLNNKDVNNSLKQMVVAIAMLPDFQVR